MASKSNAKFLQRKINVELDDNRKWRGLGDLDRERMQIESFLEYRNVNSRRRDERLLRENDFVNECLCDITILERAGLNE